MASSQKRSFQDQIDELDDMIISILDTRNIKKMNRRRYLQMNADFIYLLALFERFVGHFIIYAISKKKSVKEDYVNLFNSVCDEKIRTLKKSGAEAWRVYYNKPKKMIDDYAILEKEKNGMVIMRELLKNEIQFSEEGLSESLKIYSEARARRNLLAHRGRKPDKIYWEEIKKGRISDKLHKEILKFGLYSSSTRKGDRERDEITGRLEAYENDLDNPIDLSITPSFLISTCLNLIFIKECFLMDFKDKDLSTNLHEYIVDGVDSKKTFLLSRCYSIFRRKIKLHSKITELNIDEKVNYVLLREYLFQRKLLKRNDTHINNTNKIIESIKEKDHELAKYVKSLLRSYVDKNTDEFFKHTKNILNHSKSTVLQINNWLIFKRYLRSKKFKDLFERKTEAAIKEFLNLKKKKGSNSMKS